MRTSRSLFRKCQRALLLFVVALALPAVLFSQAYFGTVNGTLSDGTGAVVEGAKVVLTDQQKGFSFTTTSDRSGRYLFRSVPPGFYSVSANAKGFDKALSAKFKVDVNENATTNLTLKVAAPVRPSRSGRRRRPSKPKMRRPARSSIAGSSMICR